MRVRCSPHQKPLHRQHHAGRAGRIHLRTSTSGLVSTTLDTGSTLAFDLFTGAGLGDNSALATAADRLTLAGALSIATGALLEIDNPNGLTAWAAGDRWRLFDWTGVGAITGSYLPVDITLPALGPGLVWDTSDLFTTTGPDSGILDIEAVSEPGNALMGLGCALSLAFRRKRTAIGRPWEIHSLLAAEGHPSKKCHPELVEGPLTFHERRRPSR